ncbi:VIT1/CCC1 transporter family protein [Variovorax rhizosphaerae]|uniref:VIT1/CCC1 transporter family protein n=1 Tax=Variovorax rhizosphaerae TaxID=1836200 RepID=A0ABU8WYC1_9BURK
MLGPALLLRQNLTGTLSVATAGREDVRAVLLAALGCNTAWGLVDGVMYVLRNIVGRGRQARLRRAVLAAEKAEMAHGLIAKEIGELSGALGAPEFERARQWLVARSAQGAPAPELKRRDLRGGFGVFLLVFLSTFPPVLPFLVFTDLRTAMRFSGAIAIAMMFVCGHEWGRYAGMIPWRAALVMVLLGVTVEAIVIALGG